MLSIMLNKTVLCKLYVKYEKKNRYEPKCYSTTFKSYMKKAWDKGRMTVNQQQNQNHLLYVNSIPNMWIAIMNINWLNSISQWHIV